MKPDFFKKIVFLNKQMEMLLFNIRKKWIWWNFGFKLYVCCPYFFCAQQGTEKATANTELYFQVQVLE